MKQYDDILNLLHEGAKNPNLTPRDGCVLITRAILHRYLMDPGGVSLKELGDSLGSASKLYTTTSTPEERGKAIRGKVLEFAAAGRRK